MVSDTEPFGPDDMDNPDLFDTIIKIVNLLPYLVDGPHTLDAGYTHPERSPMCLDYVMNMTWLFEKVY